MKKKRRGLAVLLVFVMVLAMGLMVHAADAKLYLSAADNGSGTLTVSCLGEQVPAFTNIKVRIRYNADKLNLTKCTAGTSLKNGMPVINSPLEGNLEEGEVILVFANGNAVTLNGSLLDLTFTIRDGAELTAEDLVLNLEELGDTKTNLLTSVSVGDTVYSKETSAQNSTGHAIESRQPTLKVTVAGAKKLKLSWSAVSGAEKYEISYATKANGTYTLPQTVTGTSCTLTMPKKNQTYYFKVRAAAISGGTTYYSKYSSVVSAKAYGKPSKPTLKVKKSGNKLKLSWNKQSEIKKYEIYCKVGKGKYQKIKTVKGKKTSCKISTKKYASGQKLSFRIRAYYQVDGVKIYGAKSKVVKITL